MTEKRFKATYDDGYCVCDNETDLLYHMGNDMITNEMTKLLNALHEENQELHKTIEELDNCQKGQSHRINDLYLENKQLKDLITHLGYTIKYDGYRHISLELKR